MEPIFKMSIQLDDGRHGQRLELERQHDPNRPPQRVRQVRLDPRSAEPLLQQVSIEARDDETAGLQRPQIR